MEKNPEREEPWLAETAITLLKNFLQSDKTVVFEFGSGASTVWLANRSYFVYSAEHDQEWLEKTTYALNSHAYNDNFELFLCERPYNTKIEKFEDAKFDLILVDGRDRVKCVIAAIPKLKPGGWLVLDNSERDYYLPAINLMKDWNQVHCLQKQKDGYGFTYPNWTTSIFIKPIE